MKTIRIIGLGSGSMDDMTIKAHNALCDGTKTFIRTNRHPIVSEMKNKNIEYETYDEFFEQYDEFELVYEKILEDLLENVEKSGVVNYCTPGSPYYGDVITKKLLSDYDSKYKIEVYDGLGFLDKCMKLSGYTDYKSIKVLDCLEADEFSFDYNSANFITQVDSVEIASELKIKLMEVYPDDFDVLIIDVLSENVKKIHLFDIDRVENYDFSTYFCILPIEIYKKALYNISNLCRLVKTLRGPDGCPWDMSQTHESLRNYVIEEAYEVVSAIDNEDTDNLCEELGDLLLQVVLHSEIASEEGYFNIKDVISSIYDKLIFRHPHVFNNQAAVSSDEAKLSWEKQKAIEKNIQSYTNELKSVPASFSPLTRSYKIQQKAAKVGFDWPDVDGAIEKVKEEIQEVIVEYKKRDCNALEGEIGDLLFAIVNFARYMNINPDTALNMTINKFIYRFGYIEEHAEKDLKELTLQEMDELWEKSKIL